MQQDKLQFILKELYELDPNLQKHGDRLDALILKLLEAKPEAKIDARFAAKLRNELVSSEPKQSFIFNIFSMSKVPFVVAGGLATFVLVVVAGYFVVNQKYGTGLDNFVLNKKGNKTIQLAANAFGSLGDVVGDIAPSAAPQALLGTEEAISRDNAIGLPGIGAGGGGGVNYAAQAEAIGSDQAISSISIVPAPPYYEYSYKFKYIGDEFTIEDSKMPVYRLAIDNNMQKNIANSILSTNLGFIDLSQFSGASVGSIHLSQKDGYNLYLNFEQGRISMNKQQDYYEIAVDDCGSETCLKRYEEPKYSQVADSVLISAAEKFLDKYSIDRSFYGVPEVDNSWKIYTPESTYVPRMQSVIFPLSFGGKTVHEFGGYTIGMRVVVDLADMSVQSANEIFNPLFESSNYEIETDFARILDIAENGGIQRIFYGAREEGEVIELGTPEYIYMHQYDYTSSNSRARELYIPALKFPILNAQNNRNIYQTSIIVPLAKDVLDKYDKQLPPDGVKPMPLPPIGEVIIMEGPPSSEASEGQEGEAVSGSTGSGDTVEAIEIN